MQILSVHLINIKSHRDTEISFSPGINVLSGPNGAGKSTVFEAVGYALFGVNAQDFVSRAERFLSIGAKRGEIRVTFQPGDGDTWRVTRTVGPAAKWLLARQVGADFEVEEHAGLHETEARIARLLKLDNGRSLADQFKLVIGPFQNDFLGPFVIRQPTRRQDAFDEILGIDTWRKTFAGTKELMSTIQGKIQILQAEVAGKKEQLAVLPDKAAELQRAKAEDAAKQAELAVSDQALAAATLLLTEIDGQKNRLDGTLAELRQVEERITAGHEYVVNQRLLVEQALAAAKIVTDTGAGKESFDQAEIRLNGLREQEKAKLVLERRIAELDKQHAGIRQAIEMESRESAALSVTADGDAKRLAEEGEGLAAVIGVLREKEAAQQQLLDGIRELRTSFATLPLQQVENTLPYLRMALQRIEAIDAELADRTEQLAGEDAAAASARQLPSLKVELEKLRGERAQIEGRKVNLHEGRDKLAEGVCPFFQEPCENLAENPARDVFTSRLAAMDAEAGTLDAQIAALVESVATAELGEKELAGCTTMRKELSKLSLERQAQVKELASQWRTLSPELFIPSLEEWLQAAELQGRFMEELKGLVADPAAAPAEQLAALDAWSDSCRHVCTSLDQELAASQQAAEEPLQAIGREVAGLSVRLEQHQLQKRELDDRYVKIRERNQHIAGLKIQLQEVGEALAARQHELRSYAGLEEGIAKAQQELAANQEARDLYIANLQAAEELAGRQVMEEKYRERLAGRELERQTMARQLEELQGTYRADRHEQVRQEKERLLSAVATVREQLSGIAGTRCRLEGEIVALKAVRDEVEKKLAAVKSLQEKEVLVKFLRNHVFKNVSTQLSERFREEISLRADRIYRTIAESDEELYWGDNYQIVLRDIVDGNIRERSDDQLSGGQMMSAVVALRLALLQTIGARVAFFDEPTSNLDAGRRENLASAFRAIDVGQEEVTEHWYDQLFLVSHDVAFTEITDKIIEL